MKTEKKGDLELFCLLRAGKILQWNEEREKEPERKIDLSKETFMVGLNFAGANLTYVNFSRSDLRGCNFKRANLSEAEMEEADVRGACFQKAILEDCNMKNAKTEEADFDGAVTRGLIR